MKKRELRELRILVSSTFYISKGILEANKDFYMKSNGERLTRIHSLYDKLGYTEEERKLDWIGHKRAHMIVHNSYYGKPPRVRKDNKTEINRGSGSGNITSIRYPKKCRKTAWKRFLKLFGKYVKDTR